MAAEIEHARLMDRVYRHQRHFYDITRKFYLLGRDPMIAGLRPPAGGSVLEIGCGTGRNLVKAAKRYPGVRFFGVDISRQMLDTAAKAVTAAGYRDRARLACADAAAFDPQRVFGEPAFDRIFISYAVSMIPQWRSVVANAAARLAPGGEMHIVDFGDLADLPRWSKAALYAWLHWYHVTPRPDLFATGAETAQRLGGSHEERRLYRGFAWVSVIRADRETGLDVR
ncbi:MAG: class I SAM-dependent methyltransferase [Rhizobiaceae bacterium]|jgi:S-adenosylmethionine-diacylgycerolhomoserine-N-methlytransferase